MKQPTSKSLRRIRARNFLRRCDSESSRLLQTAYFPTTGQGSPRGFVRPYDSEDPPCSLKKKVAGYEALPTSATYSHQRCRLQAPTQRESVPGGLEQSEPFFQKSVLDSVTNGSDSQQDFAEVTASRLQIDFDPSLLLSFEMLEGPSSVNERRASLRGGYVPICTLQPVRSASPVATTRVEYSREERCSADDKYASELIEQSYHDRNLGQQERHGELNNIFLLSGPRPAPSTPELISKETSNDNHHGNANRVTPSETPEPQRRRTANRHARLIDGAIFPFKGRKGNAARPSVEVQESLSPNAGRKLLFRLSWTPTRQSSESRGSWLQSVRSLFRTSQNKQRKPLPKHKHTSSIGNSTDAQLSMSKSHKSISSSTASIAPSGHPRSLGLFLDGACDNLRSPSASYLNKPLPLNPDEFAKSLSSGTRSTSIDHSHTLSCQPRSASTASTKISQTPSKREFQAIAKDLAMTRDMSTYHPDLSPVHEARLNPSKYDPLKSPKPPYS